MFEGFFHGHLVEDSQANYDAFKYSAITTLVGVVHAIFAIAFAAMNVYPMVAYNIVIVIMYFILARNLSNLNKYIIIFFSYVTEIVLHCVLATICVGWNYCFMYYLIGLIPVAFYLTFSISVFKRKLFYPTITTVIVCISYFCMRIVTYFFDPIFPTTHIGFEIFFCILNSLIAFSCTLLFSALLSVEVNSMQLMLESQQEKLEDQAAYDPLTHFLNRRSMDERLNNAHRNAIINDVPYSLIMCDIDHFKQFNDTYGHDCGDFVLQNISRIIANQVRSKDSTCRWGGEEFLILISDNKEIASEVAERIRATIDNHEFFYGGNTLHVTITLGVSSYYTSSKLKTLIEIADKHLYKGKENGRNQVVDK